MNKGDMAGETERILVCTAEDQERVLDNGPSGQPEDEDNEPSGQPEYEQDGSTGETETRPVMSLTSHWKLTVDMLKVMKIGEPIVGVCLIITMSVFVGNFYTEAPWYSLGLFIGIYILANSIIRLLSSFTEGGIQLKIRDRTYTLPVDRTWLVYMLDMVVFLAMIVTFSTMPPRRWTAGHIVGIVISVLLFIKAEVSRKIFALSLAVLDSTSAGTEHGRQLSARLRKAGQHIRAGCLGLATDETVAKAMKERRIGNLLLLSLCLLLPILVFAVELFLIRDWDTYLLHKNHALLWLYGGFSHSGIPSSLHYYPAISCAALLIVVAVLVAGAMRPTWYSNLAVSLVALGVGVYFALLSTYSLQSYMFLAPLPDPQRVWRYLQLMPIPFIASLLIAYGLSTGLAIFSLTPCESGQLRRFMKFVGCVLVTLLASASLLVTQFQCQVQVQKHWNNSRDSSSYPESGGYLDREIQWDYTVYIASIASLTTTVIFTMLTHLLSGRSMMPGSVGWALSSLVFALAVFATYGVFSVQRIRDETAGWVLLLNGSTLLLSAATGFGGMLLYAKDILAILVLILRVFGFLVLCAYYVVFLSGYKILSCFRRCVIGVEEDKEQAPLLSDEEV